MAPLQFADPSAVVRMELAGIVRNSVNPAAGNAISPGVSEYGGSGRAPPMAEPPRPSAEPESEDLVVPVTESRAGVPLTIWPGIPAPGRCLNGVAAGPCPRNLSRQAAAKVVTALTQPGDLVVVPHPGIEIVIAAARAGRQVLGLPAPGTHQDMAAMLDDELPAGCRPLARLRPGGPAGLLEASCPEAGQAALAIVTSCVPQCCPEAVTAGAGHPAGGRPAEVFTACQRVLRLFGLLAVLTAAARQPCWPGEIVAQARAAGLIYIQHIVALHAPIRDSQLQPLADAHDAGAETGRHRPAHSDLLIFAAPGGPNHA